MKKSNAQLVDILPCIMITITIICSGFIAITAITPVPYIIIGVIFLIADLVNVYVFNTNKAFLIVSYLICGLAYAAVSALYSAVLLDTGFSWLEILFVTVSSIVFISIIASMIVKLCYKKKESIEVNS